MPRPASLGLLLALCLLAAEAATPTVPAVPGATQAPRSWTADLLLDADEDAIHMVCGEDPAPGEAHDGQFEVTSQRGMVTAGDNQEDSGLIIGVAAPSSGAGLQVEIIRWQGNDETVHTAILNGSTTLDGVDPGLAAFLQARPRLRGIFQAVVEGLAVNEEGNDLTFQAWRRLLQGEAANASAPSRTGVPSGAASTLGGEVPAAARPEREGTTRH